MKTNEIFIFHLFAYLLIVKQSLTMCPSFPPECQDYSVHTMPGSELTFF